MNDPLPPRNGLFTEEGFSMFPPDRLEKMNSLAMITPSKGIISFVDPIHPEERIDDEEHIPLPLEEIVHSRSIARHPLLLAKSIVNYLIGDVELVRREAKIWRPFIEAMNRIYLDIDDDTEYHNSWFADYMSDEILELITRSIESEPDRDPDIRSQLQHKYYDFESKMIDSEILSSELGLKAPLMLFLGNADDHYILPLDELEDSPLEANEISDLPGNIQRRILHQLVEIYFPDKHFLSSRPSDPPEKKWRDMIEIFDEWDEEVSRNESPFEATTIQVLHRYWTMSQRDIAWALGSLTNTYPAPEARLAPCLPSIAFMFDPFILNSWNIVSSPFFVDSIFPWVSIPLTDEKLERLARSYMIELHGTAEKQSQVNRMTWDDMGCEVYTDEVWNVFADPKHDKEVSRWQFQVYIDDPDVASIHEFATLKATQINTVLERIEEMWHSDKNDFYCSHCDHLMKALREHEGHGTDLPVNDFLSDRLFSGIISDTIERAATLYPSWIAREITETQHSLI